MQQKAPPTNLLAFIACMALALPSPANAYLDPASGTPSEYDVYAKTDWRRARRPADRLH